jgi:cysteine-rich repeat protein
MKGGTLRLLALAAAIPALLPACEESSKVVISVETPVPLPGVSHIRVFLSNGDATDQLDFPNDDPPTTIMFPTSLAIIIPHARAGRVDIVVEAIDQVANVLGHGLTTAWLSAGGRTDSSAVLIAGPSTCGDGIVVPPEKCDDSNHFSNDDCDFLCNPAPQNRGVAGDGPPADQTAAADASSPDL